MFSFGNADGKGGPKKGGGIPKISEREFESEVLRSELPAMVAVTASASATCKQMAPELEAFSREMQGQLKVVELDLARSPTLAQRLRIQSVPTFLLVAGERILDMVSGVMSKKQMRAFVEPALPRAEGAIKPAELAVLIKEGSAIPVDTRDAAAYGRARVPGAKHFPIEEIETRLAELHMLSARPVVYCRSGDKTKELAGRLAEQGMPVAYLEGGLLAWEAEGLPVDR